MLNVKSVNEVIQVINDNFPSKTKCDFEEVDIISALSCVTYDDIYSQDDIPGFNRSTVDGYGVKSRDTFGCSESIPALLQIVGSVEMGQDFETELQPGQCIYIPTGGIIPKGVDGVVMVEYSECFDENTIGITKACGPGENIIHKGEDVARGSIIIKKGTKLRPQDIGALAACGISKIKVNKPVRVSIISTGNEIVDIDSVVKMGEVRDVNGYAIASAVIRDGGHVVLLDRVKDDKPLIESMIKKALEVSDIVFLSGGSSVGVKDMSYDILTSLGKPGVLVHGIAVKPGKPTIIANIEGKAVVGLPGHPVSALVIYNIIGSHIVKNLMALSFNKPSYVVGEFEKNYPKAPGREEYIMVEVEVRDGKNYVKPIYGKSGLITSMTKAIGYVRVDVNKEGIRQGELVEVIPF